MTVFETEPDAPPAPPTDREPETRPGHSQDGWIDRSGLENV